MALAARRTGDGRPVATSPTEDTHQCRACQLNPQLDQPEFGVAIIRTRWLMLKIAVATASDSPLAKAYFCYRLAIPEFINHLGNEVGFTQQSRSLDISVFLIAAVQ